MDIVSGVLDYVLNELGSTVTLSILMGLLAIGAGMKAQKAISQAVMFGVGFSAMSLVIGYMTESISPAAEAMTANIVAVGCINEMLQIVDRESLKAAVLDSVPKGTEELNARALEEGIKLAGQIAEQKTAAQETAEPKKEKKSHART